MAKRKSEAAEVETAVEEIDTVEFDFEPVINQGRAAKASGLPADANPYGADNPLADAWLGGYTE